MEIDPATQVSIWLVIYIQNIITHDKTSIDKKLLNNLQYNLLFFCRAMLASMSVMPITNGAWIWEVFAQITTYSLIRRTTNYFGRIVSKQIKLALHSSKWYSKYGNMHHKENN